MSTCPRLEHPVHKVRQAGTIIAVTVIGIISLLGIVIFSSVYEAMPTIKNADLDQSATTVVDGFASSFDLIPVVMLVFVAIIVIASVQRLRGVRPQ